MKNLLKGLIIGLSNAVPGVCSASMAMMLGVYDDILLLTAKPFKRKSYEGKGLFLAGILLGIVATLWGVKYLFTVAPFYTLVFFSGINFGGLTKSLLKQERVRLIYFVIGISIVLLTQILPVLSSGNPHIWQIILAGSFVAIAFILPGISGSLVLLILGVYFIVIENMEKIFMAVTSLRLPNFDDVVFLSLFIGAFVLTLVVTSRIIKKAMQNHSKAFISLALGMITGSVILLIKETVKCYDDNIITLVKASLLAVASFWGMYQIVNGKMVEEM